MGKAQLVVSNVVAGYKTYKIRNISFSLQSGDILGLLGRSGAGKSTVISALLGTHKALSGSIDFFVDGKKEPLTKYVGYSPQFNSLYPFLTVKENILSFASLYGIPREDAYNRMNYFLKRLNLSGSENKLVTQLSGGMKKRLDLIISLIHNPLVIILDEPFAGLDIYLQVFLWKFIKELAHEGKIIIIASHLINSVQRNCNKFALIYNGYYYDNNQLVNSMIKSREVNIEDFLVKLFIGGNH